MLIGLFLRKRGSEPSAPSDLVAYGKTHEEILGWYKFHNEGAGAGAVDSPLKDYIPLEETIYTIREEDSVLGFMEIADLAMIEEDCEEMVEAVHMQARMHLDNYRDNIEPKAISFDIHSTPNRSIQ